MKNVFEIVTRISNVAGKIAQTFLSVAMFVALWGAITATTIFGFYFISSGVMALFTIVFAIAAIAGFIWFVGFAWKLFRFFFPKIEPLNAGQ